MHDECSQRENFNSSVCQSIIFPNVKLTLHKHRQSLFSIFWVITLSMHSALLPQHFPVSAFHTASRRDDLILSHTISIKIRNNTIPNLQYVKLKCGRLDELPLDTCYASRKAVSIMFHFPSTRIQIHLIIVFLEA